MPLYNMIRSKVADADATSSSWSDAASSAGSDDGVEVELRGAAGANGIPPMDELVAVMGEARAVVATYLEQAVLARLLRRRGGGSRGAGGVETFEERAAEVQGIKDRLAAVGALGHYATTLGKTPAGAAGAGSGARTRMLLRGKEVEVLNAGCLSYLDLERHPDVIAASKAALDEFGTSITNSRAVCGSCPIHTQLEAEVADFLAKEAPVLFPSGWTACMAAVKGIARQGDLVLIDAAAHDCLRTGARLSRATVVKFKSADPADLERALKKHRHRHTNALIITEAIFSVDGAVLPEAAFSALSRAYGCCLLVDVAHALGVWGAGGRGLDDVTRADVIVGTFSKSLVTAGGFVAAAAPLAGLVATAGLVTTANMSNANAAAALAALRLVRREPGRVAELRSKIAYARAALAERVPGLVLQGDGAVIHVPTDTRHPGDSVVAWRLVMAQGVYCQLMCYPAVGPNQAGPRFAITSAMTRADIDCLVAAVAGMWRTLPLVRAAYDERRRRGGGALARRGGRKGLLSSLAVCIGHAAAVRQ